MLEQEHKPDIKVPHRVVRSREEHGEIAQVLSEYERRARKILATYIPNNEIVDEIISSQKDSSRTIPQTNFDPVEDCFNKALDAAYIPGNAMGKTFPHPIDFLAAGKILEKEQSSRSKKPKLPIEGQLWVLGITEHTLSNTKNMPKDKHREAATTLFALSLDIEKERAALHEVKDIPFELD